jgi:hypothetical protein
LKELKTVKTGEVYEWGSGGTYGMFAHYDS